MNGMEQHEGLKLLTKEVTRLSDESGEEPSFLVKCGDKEIACHRTLLISKCPGLIERTEKGYRLDEDMEQELKHNMISVLYFLYTDSVRFWNGHKFGLVCVAISYDLLELANEASKIVMDDDWTCITGLHAGMCVTNRYPMDEKFTEHDVCIHLQKIPHDFVPLDLWDFKGKSLSTEVTPRQLMMVEKGVNVLEFDTETLKLLKKDGIEKQKFVKIDVELGNPENRKGGFLSPLTRDSESLRIKMVFPKSQKGGAVGMYLLAAGVRVWSRNVSGNLILVNQLDRKKDIVRKIATTLSETVSDWGYAEMFSMDDITDPSKGFVKDGVIICKARVLVDGHRIATYRYAQIMERRKKAQVKSRALSGSQHEGNVKKQPICTKISDEEAHPLCKNTRHVDHIQEVGCASKVTSSTKMVDKPEVQIKDEKHEIPIHHKDVAENVLDELISSVVSEAELNQGLCESLPQESFGRGISSIEEWNLAGEDSKKIRKNRKPTCNARARHRCSRCLEVRFCSQECSNQHWGVHREQCNLIRERKERDREEIMD